MVFKSHESRLLRFSRCFPASCGAAWGGYGAAWAATVPRTGNEACMVFTNHETRLFRPFPLTGRQTFLLERTRPPNQAFHESRDTNHGLYPFLAAFLQVVERHGAAMARLGRPPSPAPAKRFFKVFTNHRPNHESRHLFFTNHETRNTNHGFFSNHSFPTHDFPPFPGISHHFPAPPPPSAVLGRPHRVRRQPPLPPPAGKHENGSPREHDSNVNL